jgi:hypothetical protein
MKRDPEVGSVKGGRRVEVVIVKIRSPSLRFEFEE